MASPPKAHAYVSLPLQSGVVSYPSVEQVLTNGYGYVLLCNPLSCLIADLDGLISICVGLAIASTIPFGVLILLMEAEVSATHVPDFSLVFKHASKGKEKEDDKMVVDIGYVVSYTVRDRKPYHAVFDRLDPTSLKLKSLYPTDAVRVVNVPEAGPG